MAQNPESAQDDVAKCGKELVTSATLTFWRRVGGGVGFRGLGVPLKELSEFL